MVVSPIFAEIGLEEFGLQVRLPRLNHFCLPDTRERHRGFFNPLRRKPHSIANPLVFVTHRSTEPLPAAITATDGIQVTPKFPVKHEVESRFYEGAES